MLKIISIFILLPWLALSQPAVNKYFIKFTDKSNNGFSINNPSQFLSSRAIARRSAQNIPVTDRDLPLTSNYILGVGNTGSNILARIKWFNGVVIECDSAQLASVLVLPFVESSTRVFRRSNSKLPDKFKSGIPFSNNTSMRVSSLDYGDSFNQIHLMNGEFLHDAGYTGNGMMIAILDAGFYNVDLLSPFDYIRIHNQIISTWDFVSNDSLVYDDATHGMMVLSAIAGNVPGSLVGTAPDASFLLLRSEDGNSESIIEEYNWAAAAEYADSAGADVISSSLGYTEFDDSTFNHTYSDMDGNHCPSSIAADIAASVGMLVVNSAGNSGGSQWHYIGAPSDGDSVMAVGAVDSSGFFVNFSSYGPSADGDVKPNVAAKGYQSTVADQSGGITTASGTSFSCPILAGAATCLWQEFPSKSAMEIKSAIERSANYYLAPNDSMGYGIPDFRIASFLLTTGSINMPSEDKVLGVFPNPFTENINVRFYSITNQKVTIELINSIGQISRSETKNASPYFVNNFTIYTDKTLRTGIYFLRISTGSANYVSRIVKN